MNPRRSKLAIPLLALFAACTGAGAADLYVIGHPSVNLEASDIRDVYLGEKQFSGAVRLHPVDNAGAQDAFLADVMHMSPTAYGASWTKKAFRQGLTQPPLQATDVEVIEFVKRNEGAVGYVKAAPAGVKVFQKLSR